MSHKRLQSASVNTSPLTIRNILIWMGIMLILIVLPYLAVWQGGQPDKDFLGALVNPHDISVYLSAMRQGANGRLLFHFNFSPEYLPPRLTYPLYLLMGRWAAWVGGSIMLWFHIFRVIASIIAMLGLLFLVRIALLGNRRLQSTAWLFSMFSGGIGWLIAILSLSEIQYIPDLSRPEWGMLLPMLGTPHFAFGLGLELFLFGAVLRMRQKHHGYKWAMAGAVIAAALGLVYPYLIPITGLIIGLYLLALAGEVRGIPYGDWIKGAIVIAPLLPLFYYFGIWAQRDPNWKFTHVQNNIITPPSPIFMIIGLGIIGILALVGLPRWMRQRRSSLIPIWALTNLIALYLPVPFSGRFILGLVIPICILASVGLEDVVLPYWQKRAAFEKFSRLTPTPYDTTRRIIFILTIPAVLVIILLLVQSPMIRPDAPLYMDKTEINAAMWFAENVEDDNALLLVSYPVGNYLPRLTDKRVFIGQAFLTINLDEKIMLLQQFWDKDTADSWRTVFLQEWGISHIYVGRYERELMDGVIDIPGQLIYDQGDVSIYEIIE